MKTDDQTCFDVFIQSNLTEITVKDLTLAGKSVDGGNYTFNNTKRFTFKPNSHFSLIETDKPVYKPGDKVNIRILSLDYLLRPKPTRFSEVFVTDSSGSRVSQWLDVNNKNGRVDVELIFDALHFLFSDILRFDRFVFPAVRRAKSGLLESRGLGEDDDHWPSN